MSEPVMKRFGEKAHRFITRHPSLDKKYTLLEGSVRSSKTFAVDAKLITQYCRYQVQGKRVICGATKQTVYKNILLDVFSIVGKENYSYNQSSGELWLFGVQFFVIGAKDEASYRNILGMTIGLALVDEWTEFPESFTKQLFMRLSPPGAKLVATTNPGTPLHYLYTDVIKNPEMQDSLEVIHFTLDDNPNLLPEVRREIEASQVGSFKLRYILGLWVVAEGAIYRDAWSDERVLFSDPQQPGQPAPKYEPRPIGLLGSGGFAERFYSADIGTQNATCFLEWYSTGKVAYVTREWYWDCEKRMRQLTSEEQADEFEKWAGVKRVKVIVDPAAANFKLTLQQHGYYVKDGVNDVVPGIQKVSSALALGLVRIHEGCTNLIEQMQSYSWSEKAAKLGREEPVKQNDHACFVRGTLVLTENGNRPIETMAVGDYVITPMGRSKVLACMGTGEKETVPWNGTRVTPEHPVFVHGKGWIRVDAVSYTDLVCEASQYLSMASPFAGTQTPNASRIRDISNPTPSTFITALRHCTARFGRALMAQFQRAITYTIETVTQAIMRCGTLSVFPALNICPCTASETMSTWSTWNAFGRSPLSGIAQKRGASGIGIMPGPYSGTARSIPTTARIAVASSNPRTIRVVRSSAAMRARQPLEENPGLMMNPDAARCAVASSVLTDTLRLAPVVASAERSREEVFALKTEHGCFFANGVLVSNCDAFRYGLVTHFPHWRLSAR